MISGGRPSWGSGSPGAGPEGVDVPLTLDPWSDPFKFRPQHGFQDPSHPVRLFFVFHFYLQRFIAGKRPGPGGPTSNI